MKLNFLNKTNIEEVLSSEREKYFTNTQSSESLSDLFDKLDIKTQNDFDFDDYMRKFAKKKKFEI